MREFESSPTFKDINRDVFEQYYSSAKEILQIYPNIEKDYPNFLLLRNPLNRFLSTGYQNNSVMDKLLRIGNFEVFRRAIQATSDKPDLQTPEK